MATGIRTWDAAGNLLVDISDRLVRFLGSPLIVSDGSSGSITNAGFLTGSPFYIISAYDNNGWTLFPGERLYGGTVSISGSTLTYNNPTGMGAQIIQYGVY